MMSIDYECFIPGDLYLIDFNYKSFKVKIQHNLSGGKVEWYTNSIRLFRRVGFEIELHLKQNRFETGFKTGQ